MKSIAKDVRKATMQEGSVKDHTKTTSESIKENYKNNVSYWGIYNERYVIKCKYKDRT